MMPRHMHQQLLLCYLVLKVMVMFFTRFLIEVHGGTHSIASSSQLELLKVSECYTILSDHHKTRNSAMENLSTGWSGHSYWTWWIIRSAIPKPPSGYFSSVSSHLI